MKNKIWLITGAGRGMGVDITKAALAAGHKVVATGRNTSSVAKTLGVAENFLIVKLECVTNEKDESSFQCCIKDEGRPLIYAWRGSIELLRVPAAFKDAT